MKTFLKTLPTRHPLATQLMTLHGHEAFTWLSILLELAQDIGTFELTPNILARECHLKNPKLSRVFPDIKECFEKAQVILGILNEVKVSSSKSKLNELSSDKLNKVDLSSTSKGRKQRGSTRDLEKSREEESREEDPPLPPDGGNEKKVSAFGEFYEKYPRKTYKQQSEVFWNKKKLDGKLPEILEGLERYKVSERWTKQNGEFICDPIRFLTQERWKDYPEPPRPQAVKRPIGTMLGGNEITPAHLRPNGPIKL